MPRSLAFSTWFISVRTTSPFGLVFLFISSTYIAGNLPKICSLMQCCNIS
jgi:hypothetical protein